MTWTIEIARAEIEAKLSDGENYEMDRACSEAEREQIAHEYKVAREALECLCTQAQCADVLAEALENVTEKKEGQGHG